MEAPAATVFNGAMNMNDFTTLVIGGTGKTGRRVAERLGERGLPVRIGSRTAEPGFDWDDPGGWAAALAGVDAAYVSYYPDLAVPGSTDAIGTLTEVAREAGLSRLVLLSGRGEREAEAAEQVVLASGIESTVVRASWFNQNFDEGHFAEPVMAGEIALPVGDVREPFVDTDDIADVAVAALTEDGHAGKLYEVTGPRLMTFQEAVGEIAEASGREIAYVPISMDDYVAGAKEAGVSEDEIWLITYLFNEVLDGRNESVTHGVREALGREPRDFSDYVRDATAAGAWEQAR